MGYNPQYENNNNRNKLKIKCPMKFAYPEMEQLCITDKCAWWMPIQRACAINVNARNNISPELKQKLEDIHGAIKGEY